MAPSSDSPRPDQAPASAQPRFDVPLAPDQDYLALLVDHARRLESVHLALGPELIPDARTPLRDRGAFANLDQIASALEALPAVPAYVLANSSFHAPDTLTDQGVAPLVRGLDLLAKRGLIQGIVFADFYLLRALERAAPSLCAALEAVPSINCGLDSLPRIAALMQRLERTAFRPPPRLVLDRNLNRRLEELQALRRAVDQRFPGTRLLLLANEGCLLHCPFKTAHDALIGLAHLDPCQERTFALNRDLGCSNVYFEHPEDIFRSPLIRPEDLGAYADLCHGFKLCGRTRDPAALTRIVAAYIKGRYAGNLLELADSMEGLAQALYVDNQALPPNLARDLSDCSMDCLACGRCRELALNHVKRLSPAIAPVLPHP